LRCRIDVSFSRAAGEQKQTILQELNENQGFQFLCYAIDLTAIEADDVTDIDEYENFISIYGDENENELNSTSSQLGSVENLDPLQLGQNFDAEVYVEDHNLSIGSTTHSQCCTIVLESISRHQNCVDDHKALFLKLTRVCVDKSEVIYETNDLELGKCAKACTTCLNCAAAFPAYINFSK